MYLHKSNILLLTTTLFTSIVVATRPSSATPVVSLDTDAEVTQPNVDRSVVDEDIYSIGRRDVWADAHSLLQSIASAKAQIHLAERAEILATATKYNAETSTTDITSSIGTLRGKLADLTQVEAQENATSLAQQSTEPRKGAYSAPAVKQLSSVERIPDTAVESAANPFASDSLAANIVRPSDTPDTKPYGPAADESTDQLASNRSTPISLAQSPNTQALSSPSLPPVNSQSVQPSNTVTKPSAPESPAASSQPTHNPISAEPNANHVKRGAGTYEYIYDSTTVLVTATSPRQSATKTGTRKLRFGAVSLAPTTKKSG